MSTKIVEKLKQEIAGLASETKTERVGLVSAVSDGIVEIEGLIGAKMMEMVAFDVSSGKNLKDTLEDTSELYGLVLNLEEDSVKAVILGDSSRVREGMVVKETGRLLSVPVGGYSGG